MEDLRNREKDLKGSKDQDEVISNSMIDQPEQLDWVRRKGRKKMRVEILKIVNLIMLMHKFMTGIARYAATFSE